MPPNQPEEKNKTNEKARKEEKDAGGAWGAGRALTKRAWIIPKKAWRKEQDKRKGKEKQEKVQGVRGRVDALASERHGPVGTDREAESALLDWNMSLEKLEHLLV